MSLHHGHTIHASAPNRGSDRRVGVAIQQYLPAHVRERDGGGYAQLVRGEDTGGGQYGCQSRTAEKGLTKECHYGFSHNL